MKKFIKPLKIGKIKLENNLLLAPMVDVTDLPFRILAKKYGAGLVYTPMLYTSQILNKNKKTLDLMRTNKKENLAIQITGNNIEEFKKVIPCLKNFILVDLNCGCPSIKITGTKAGSYLLKDPKKINSIIKLLKKAGLTVTAKIRLGFKENNVLEIVKKIESAGADAITVHPRLATDGKSIPADWNWIKKIKSKVKIPVIGNGDIFKPEDVEKMIIETNCDGVMIARSAIGSPEIFKKILDYEKNGKYKELTKKEKIKNFLKYLNIAKKEKVLDLGRIKYLGSSFLRSFENAPKLREKFTKLKNINEIEEFLKKEISNN